MRAEAYRSIVENVPLGHLEFVNVTGDSFNYWNAIASRWLGKFDLMTIEQDNVIPVEAFSSFSSCPKPWCCYSYYAQSAFSNRFLCTSMGCAKFSAQLQREVAFIGPTEWMYIDQSLGHVLREASFSPHIHGEIDHLHEYGTDNDRAKAKAAQLIAIAAKKG